MGRPIKKTFFGNLNTPPIGGESISSTITVTSTGSNYSNGSVAVFSDPQIPGGSTAAGTLSFLNGGISAVTLTSGGSGYSSTATISITTASSVTKASTGTTGETTIYPANLTGLFVGMSISGTGVGASSKIQTINTNSITVTVANASTVTGSLVFADLGSGFEAVTALTTSKYNALAVTAYIPGGSAPLAGDIIKQEASTRYLVTTDDGTGQCKLAAVTTATEGQMTLIATDSDGGEYWVTKLTARRARLVQISGIQFDNNAMVKWNITTPVENESVTLANS